MQEKPVWLQEQPDILKALHLFLDKLDKKPFIQWSQPPSMPVNDKTLPGLFVQGEGADETWALLKSLEQDYHIITIRLHKKRNPLDPEYFNARLRLMENGETVLREWLQRPYAVPVLQQWRDAVREAAHQFPGDTAKFSSRPISLSDKSAAQIVQGFERIADYQHHKLTLRQLSSVCFWGRSKFLDGRRDLVMSLFPNLQLSLRPVVVNIYLPENMQGILFIENQDSYTCAMQGTPQDVRNLALVYSAGFKSSAARIRKQGGVSLHFSGCGVEKYQSAFERYWLDGATDEWPLWFWGDLDFAGMNILKQLIKRFPSLRAWPPGYHIMLEHLRNGNAYKPAGDEVQTQVDPGTTGCAYADAQLLPVLRAQGLFVDQEIVY